MGLFFFCLKNFLQYLLYFEFVVDKFSQFLSGNSFFLKKQDIQRLIYYLCLPSCMWVKKEVSINLLWTDKLTNLYIFSKTDFNVNTIARTVSYKIGQSIKITKTLGTKVILYNVEPCWSSTISPSSFVSINFNMEIVMQNNSCFFMAGIKKKRYFLF